MHLAAAASKISNETEATKLGLRWYQSSGGCCDVHAQVEGKILEKIKSCPSPERKSSFLPFYETELKALVKEMALATDGKLAHGFTHGDPFADNVMVDETSGTFSAFIDVEDICIGPLLFDLACCAIGCCFQERPSSSSGGSSKFSQVLDFDLFEALLKGYRSERELLAIEVEHLVPFMRLALLCNCSWRFVKFNVPAGDDDFPEEAKNSYMELQHRIEYLHDADVVTRIQKQLAQQ